MFLIKHPFSSEAAIRIREVVIKHGGVLSYPTETFYAIGCDATNSDAVKRVYSVKRRQKCLPLLVLINRWDMLSNILTDMSQELERFLQKYWPGPLTVILPVSGYLADELNYNGENVGIRMTSSKIAGDIIDITGRPLVGTSANLSSEKEISTIEEVRAVFNGKIDLYIDGGKTPGIHPSTMLDLTRPDRPKIIRQGAVAIDPREDLMVGDDNESVSQRELLLDKL
jgi:L-threonylcarbamoyladenylate synthase